MDVRRSAAELLGDPGKRRGAVDQDFELVTRPGRRIATCPSALGGVECVLPPDSPQPATVVGGHGAVDGLPDLAIEPKEGFMY
jgi:hypothetical protein